MVPLFVASVIWSFSFGLIGNQLAGLPAAWLAAVRLAVAALVFLPFVRRVPIKVGAMLFVIGMVQFGLMSLAYMSSFHYLKSHEVALFTVMTPVYVVVVSDLISRSFHGVNLLAALLSVIGAGAILWKGVASDLPFTGFLLVEASNLCFALGQLAYREVLKRTGSPVTDRQVFFWLYLGGLVALLPFGMWDDVRFSPCLSIRQTGVLLYLGVMVSGLSYFLWNSGARQVSSGLLAVMNNVKIPLSVLVSLLLFHESVNTVTLSAGAVLIVASFVPLLSRSS